MTISSEHEARIMEARLAKFEATRMVLSAMLADEDFRACQLQLSALDFEIQLMRDELASFAQAFEG